MSSHCNRYPACGCLPDIGTKCQLPDGHVLLLRAEQPDKRTIDDISEELAAKLEGRKPIKRNELGYPLLEDGSVDWELTGKEKEAEMEKYERIQRGASSKKPHKKHATNYTPPKRRRK